tara:strand:- start:579 stop:1358 length:780 start_codon:yes stop_codon:yes gene_type:complete
MNDINSIINDSDISVGSTKRMNCPVCNGYNTFSITNNMGSLVWNCYKASCSVSGAKDVHLNADDIRAQFQVIKGATQEAKDKFVLPEYIVPHNHHVTEWANELYGIDAEELGLMYDVKEHRVVFPVVHDGVVVDATGRSLGKKIPKWKRYGKSDLPYINGCGSVAVVVEDCVSASVVGSLGSFVGVAVLGTSISDAHKKYLTRFSTAIIALDPDALPKTMSAAKELRGFVPDVKVLRLIDDLKYRNEKDITNLTDLIGE